MLRDIGIDPNANRGLFKQLDENQDGYISIYEALDWYAVPTLLPHSLP